MPPTFFFVIGFIVYLFLVGLTILVSVPLLFIERKKAFAQKTLGIVIISFPCLVVVTISLMILLALPGLLFIWVINEASAAEKTKIIVFLSGLLLFSILVAISSLYTWYFLSRLITRYVDKEPLSVVYDNDKVFQYLKKLLTSFKWLKFKAKNYR